MLRPRRIFRRRNASNRNLCARSTPPFSLTSSSAKLIFIPSLLSAHLNLQFSTLNWEVKRCLLVGTYFCSAKRATMPEPEESNKKSAAWSRTRRMVNISVHVVNGLVRFLPMRRFLLDVGRSITRTEYREREREREREKEGEYRLLEGTIITNRWPDARAAERNN